EMAATARQHGDCHRALDLASIELGYGPSGEDLPYLALDSTHLARWRGNCLIQFGDPSTITDLTTAPPGLDGSFTPAQAGLPLDLGRLNWFCDLLRVPAHEHDMFGVHHAHHRLERDQVLHPARVIAGLLLQLPHCCLRRLFVVIDQAARQFPSPLVLYEPVPP